MNSEKLKEIRLTKKAKYGIVALSLTTILGIGIASISTSDNSVSNDNNQNVSVIPDQGVEDEEEVVVVENEKLAKPFTVDASIKTYYFDLSDDSKNQENALIYYNGMYTPSTGVDYFYNNTAFDVVSSFSGIVTEKKVDPLYGAMLYIKSDDNSNLVAVYASLSDISVNVGDKVSQGQVIAKAGNNTISANMGNHLNFSLLKDNKNINPINYFSKVIKDI